MADAPGVFLSHAGEDNDRFARRFAKRLKEAGFRVWFDEWELLPGDSLVAKVFEEGLKDADAMVVVLSANRSKGLEENQKVEFDITKGPKGPQAANVRPVA